MLFKQKKIYLGLFVLLFITLIIWVTKIKNGEIPNVDQWTRELVESIANSNAYTIARWLTELGSESFLVPFTIVMGIILCWIFHNFLPSIIFVGGTLVSHLLNIFIKNIVARERPSIFIEANAEGYSFPSGHAMISMVCYGLLMYLLIKKVPKWGNIIQVFFALLIFLIGISRFVINVHYLTDVISGFVIGFVVLLGFINLYEFLLSKQFLKSSKIKF